MQMGRWFGFRPATRISSASTSDAAPRARRDRLRPLPTPSRPPAAPRSSSAPSWSATPRSRTACRRSRRPRCRRWSRSISAGSSRRPRTRCTTRGSSSGARQASGSSRSAIPRRADAHQGEHRDAPAADPAAPRPTATSRTATAAHYPASLRHDRPRRLRRRCSRNSAGSRTTTSRPTSPGSTASTPRQIEDWVVILPQHAGKGPRVDHRRRRPLSVFRRTPPARPALRRDQRPEASLRRRPHRRRRQRSPDPLADSLHQERRGAVSSTRSSSTTRTTRSRRSSTPATSSSLWSSSRPSRPARPTARWCGSSCATRASRMSRSSTRDSVQELGRRKIREATPRGRSLRRAAWGPGCAKSEPSVQRLHGPRRRNVRSASGAMRCATVAVGRAPGSAHAATDGPLITKPTRCLAGDAPLITTSSTQTSRRHADAPELPPTGDHDRVPRARPRRTARSVVHRRARRLSTPTRRSRALPGREQQRSAHPAPVITSCDGEGE